MSYLLISFLLVGCGSEEEQKVKSEAVAAPKKKEEKKDEKPKEEAKSEIKDEKKSDAVDEKIEKEEK